MKKWTWIVVFSIAALMTAPSMAMQGHDNHPSTDGHDQQTDDKSGHGTHKNGMGGGTFKHHMSKDGMDADFQVMSLASMNLTSDKGETHHIMVNLADADGKTPIKGAVGKIKVLGPDGKEQTSALKNYSGILAANFTFKDPGKYGVICLVQNDGKKRVFKFWYHHM